MVNEFFWIGKVLASMRNRWPAHACLKSFGLVITVYPEISDLIISLKKTWVSGDLIRRQYAGLTS